jgi:hypothetical protein
MIEYRVVQTRMGRYYLQSLPQGYTDWIFLKYFKNKQDALDAYDVSIQEQNVIDDMRYITNVIITTEETE